MSSTLSAMFEVRSPPCATPSPRRTLVVERPNGCDDAFVATTAGISFGGGGGPGGSVVARAANASCRRRLNVVGRLANTQRLTIAVTVVVSAA
jgi:hypothetical protein